MKTIAMAALAVLAAVPLPAAAQTVVDQGMELSGRSYGGKVRAGPGMGFAQVGSTRLNQPIVLMGRAGRMGDYDWFAIRLADGRVGYQWGGLLCADGEETGVLTICGSPQDRELSGFSNRPATVAPSTVARDRNANPGPGRIIDYWCGGEGTPMRVRYVEEGEDSVAYVIHDGSRPYRLVKPWGSNGNQYEAGPNRIYGRGRTLRIELDGLVQDCGE